MIRAIDLGFLGLERAAAAFAIATDATSPERVPERILVESGPAVCLPRLRAALRCPPQAILLSHIHLDHAGASGHLAVEGTDLYVHPFGVRHLVDPAKLIASSRRVHGASFDVHFGEPLPCPAERVHSTPDGAIVDACGLGALATETPGHARHHLAWTVTIDGLRSTFTGDVGAMIVPDSRFVSIPMPPPEFDLLAWRRSLDRLGALCSDEWWLTHGGRVAEPATHVAKVRQRLAEEVDLASELVRSGIEESESVSRYQAWLWPQARSDGVSEDRLSQFLGPAFCRMNLEGVRRWLETAT